MGPAPDRGRPASCSNARSRSAGGGPYVIQAAIADLHLHEPRDWDEIARPLPAARCTSRLAGRELNRAIAVAELEGPEAGLALLDGLELDDYRYYHSTRADLLRRLGRDDEARAAYTRALELTQPGPEQRFLESRLAGLSASAGYGRAAFGDPGVRTSSTWRAGEARHNTPGRFAIHSRPIAPTASTRMMILPSVATTLLKRLAPVVCCAALLSACGGHSSIDPGATAGYVEEPSCI